MSRITVQNARGWVRSSKMSVGDLDTDLLDQVEAEVLGRIAATYDTSTWVDASTTPQLVRVVIAKSYVVALYNKAYSEDENDISAYAVWLQRNAEMLITGIVDGTIDLPGVNPSDTFAGQPEFYPNDVSSSYEPGTWGDGSLGDAKFSMGRVF